MAIWLRKWAGAGVLLLCAALALRLFASSSAGTRLSFELQSWLLRHVAVTSIPVEAVGQIKMFLDPEDAVFTKIVMRLRAWEPNETHWFVNSLRRGDTVLDIGANVGYYTVIAAKLVGESGRVYAFDPDPSSFSLLKRNVRLNGLQNVVLEQKAVSNESGSIRLYLADENKGDHRIFETPEARQFVEVEAVTLDEYFEDYAGRIDFVKIDTQGAEAAIVEGMRGLLEKNPDVVMAVEFDPSALDAFGYEAAAFLDGLGNSGFRFYDLGEWSMVGPLKKVATAALLRRFTVENEQFTNLFLTRGRMPRGHRAQKQQRYLEW